jgi:LDH2 family malate/lactate/ureidoglycolate dehydrogenase
LMCGLNSNKGDDDVTSEEVRIDAESLKAFVKQVFVRLGFPPEDAETGADLLVWANLRGVDSHGVLRLPRFVRMVGEGNLNPRPDIRVLKETPAVLFVDADGSLGAVSATFAMRRAMDKAMVVGIGWALITNTLSPLAIGYYTQMAARADMVGIAITYGQPNMPPHGARAAGLHNGPISIAVPAKDHRPVVLDMATSVVARGKIDLAIDKEAAAIPEGWALDGDGNPTIDPLQARLVVPFGGYKGADLAFIGECLSGIMAAHPLVAPVLLGWEPLTYHRQNSVMAAIDIATFTDLEGYKERVGDFIKGVKGLPKAEGFDEILVAGEPEDRVYDERVRHGIPLPEGTVRNLREVAEQVGVGLPAGLQMRVQG